MGESVFGKYKARPAGYLLFFFCGILAGKYFWTGASAGRGSAVRRMRVICRLCESRRGRKIYGEIPVYLGIGDRRTSG